ncbi:unnamed protein product, partial [Phaeothamnion confervicola]
WATISTSRRSARTLNPIRRIVDNLVPPKNSDKEIIPLSLGDPTVFGNLAAPPELTEAVARHLNNGTANGYSHSAGAAASRAAIAAAYGSPAAPLTADDIFIASGCSGSLDLVMSALMDAGDNILLPRPGFPLYQASCRPASKQNCLICRFYRLLPDRGWEADLAHLSSLVDANTRAILVNNPSNPCGSVYSESHLRAILAVAEAHRIPVISDEIYGSMAFGHCRGNAGGPLASLTTTVPVIATGGLAKQFVVPGWRVGWVLIHDRNGALTEVRKGIANLSQLVLGANTLVQAALPDVLCPSPGSDVERRLARFHRRYVGLLRDNAQFTAARLGAVPGLAVVPPQGAMYAMVSSKSFFPSTVADGETFSRALLAEESVVVLPGSCFGAPNFFRIVFSGESCF